MATLPRRPQTAQHDLSTALAAVEAAYERLMTVPRPDPDSMLDLQSRARELTDAALQLSEEAPHARHARIRRRCAGADRSVRWILRHSH
ncbi:hypothetical protein [Kitasatospora sp. NPDC088346]|uniref:hypothetical protein n=1 Tax=Kitasatospora sp. NPDC088346 TaxID=3364073 RepID=UPI0038036494